MTSPITKIETTYNVSLFTIEHIPSCVSTVARFFTAIEHAGISLDMISRAPTSKETGNISFTVSDDDFSKTAALVKSMKSSLEGVVVKVDTGNVKINLYGEPMSTQPGVAAGVFRALDTVDGLRVKLITTSEVDISILLGDEDADPAVEAIKQEFKMD